MSQRKKSRIAPQRTYSRLDEMLASPHHPLSAERRRHQLSRMWQGCVRSKPSPSRPWTTGASAATRSISWKPCSGAARNALTSRVCPAPTGGATAPATGCRSTTARVCWKTRSRPCSTLASSGSKATRSDSMRPASWPCGRCWNYRDLLDALPARTMIRAHRLTEQRVSEINSGRKRPHDVMVVDLKESA